MPLFCKQCKSRRFPKILATDEKALWLCEKCNNFVDMEDIIIREQTDDEIQENKKNR